MWILGEHMLHLFLYNLCLVVYNNTQRPTFPADDELDLCNRLICIVSSIVCFLFHRDCFLLDLVCFRSDVSVPLKWNFLVKSVQSALSDLLTTSATHGTFSRPSTKRGLILIGLELNTNVRESFEYCWSHSLNLSIDQHVCHFASWHVHCEFLLSRPFPGSSSVIWNN